MQPLGVKGQAQLLAHIGFDARFNRGHHGAGTHFDIEQDLGAKALDDFDNGREVAAIGAVARADAQILGPDAERNLTSDMGPQPLGNGWRQF